MGEVNILTETQYELLSFVAACNGSSYYPTVGEVELWRTKRNPKEAEYRTVEVEPPSIFADGVVQGAAKLADQIFGTAGAGTMSRILDPFGATGGRHAGLSLAGSMADMYRQPRTRRELVKKAELPTEHLVTLTWLEQVSGRAGLRITDLGLALLQDREREGPAETDVTVVLAKDDPIAYAKLMGSISKVGAGLLIDPYLDVEILHRLLLSTGITRVLVFADRSNIKNKNLPAIETHLSGILPRGNIEVRKTTDLHDRYVIADEDGEVLMLGTSLNGVTKKNTALISLPEPAAKATRDAHEKIWDNAELVGPPLRAVADENDEGDEQESEDDKQK